LEIEAAWSNTVERRRHMGRSAGKKNIRPTPLHGPTAVPNSPTYITYGSEKKIKIEAMGKRKVGALEKVEADL
jgi:hypothetical protein